jgi:hypothetical protein
MNREELTRMLLQVAPKDGGMMPMRFNRAQRTLHELSTQRNVVVKARQIGTSAYYSSQYFLDVILFPPKMMAIISYDKEAASRHLERIRMFYRSLPEEIRNEIPLKHDNVHEMSFPTIGSSIWIGTAGSRTFGRGETWHRVLATEYAHWLESECVNMREGILPSVPKDSGAITIECYDEDTEVLTERGWLHFKDLDASTRVLTKDRATNKGYYTLPERATKMRADELVRIDNDTVSLAVTEGHRVWAKKRDQEFKFYEASDIADYSQWNVDCSLEWEGEEREFFILPAHVDEYHKRVFPEVRIPMDLWLEFLGFFLAEGWVEAHAVSIYQIGKHAQRMRHVVEEIAKILGKKAGIYTEGSQFCIHDVRLARYLKNYTKPKRIPRELMALSTRQLLILLEAYLKGDGSVRGDGYRCYTVDVPLRDDLQELGFKLGFRTSYRIREAGVDKRGVSRQQGYIISFSRRLFPTVRKARKHVSRSPYGGFVYCVTLEKDNLLLVRRNGKAVWCGNSSPQGEGTDQHLMYLEAKSGRSPFTPIFIPWYHCEDYVLPAGHPLALPDSKFDFEYTDEEAIIVRDYGLSQDQIRWRRSKISELRSTEVFLQEFPEDDVSCFRSFASDIFDREELTRLLAQCRPPEVIDADGVQWWMKAQPLRAYLLVADTSEGVGGDANVGILLDITDYPLIMHVATLGGYFAEDEKKSLGGYWRNDDFAARLARLAAKANNCQIIVERNNTGHSVLNSLMNQLHYTNIYHQIDVLTGNEGKAGWLTTGPVKRMMVDEGIKVISSSALRTWDAELVKELRGYRRNIDGTFSAPPGRHDDRVMALLIGLVCAAGAPRVVPARTRTVQRYGRRW